jgi:hypothetical protein
MGPDEAAVVNYALEFYQTHTVSDKTFQAALIGEKRSGRAWKATRGHRRKTPRNPGLRDPVNTIINTDALIRYRWIRMSSSCSTLSMVNVT